MLNCDSFIPTNISLELGRFFLILGICRFSPFSQSEREKERERERERFDLI